MLRAVLQMGGLCTPNHIGVRSLALFKQISNVSFDFSTTKYQCDYTLQIRFRSHDHSVFSRVSDWKPIVWISQ